MYLLFGQCVGKSHETSQDLYALWADVRFSLGFLGFTFVSNFYILEGKETDIQPGICFCSEFTFLGRKTKENVFSDGQLATTKFFPI